MGTVARDERAFLSQARSQPPVPDLLAVPIGRRGRVPIVAAVIAGKIVPAVDGSGDSPALLGAIEWRQPLVARRRRRGSVQPPAPSAAGEAMATAGMGGATAADRSSL